MSHDIRPLEPDDLPALSRFLIAGFHAPDDAPFAAPDLLRWKFFDPRGGDEGPRSFVAREGGRIVGHVGICPGTFRGPGLPAGGVSTLHMIDWLSERRGTAIGAYLMMRAQQGIATQYVLGSSAAARRVLDRSGYRLVGGVPGFHKVLRPGYRLRAREPGLGGPRRAALWARDLAHMAMRRGRAPRMPVSLRAVREFGPEVAPILDVYQERAVFLDRGPGLLNHLLRCPRGDISGVLIVAGGRVAGFGLLSVVEQGGARVGKVVDCILDVDDPDAWHAAVVALSRDLKRRGADVAVGFGSTPWLASALGEAGFVSRHELEFRLRDRDRLLPDGATFHLTPLEADYAYT
jgi:hypothetical protein